LRLGGEKKKKTGGEALFTGSRKARTTTMRNEARMRERGQPHWQLPLDKNGNWKKLNGKNK
jgi:hypothetical protein